MTFSQNGGVSGGVNEILDYIRIKPGVKTTEIAAALAIPQRTLERWLKQLKSENKIVFRGAHKSGGYFVVMDTEAQHDR